MPEEIRIDCTKDTSIEELLASPEIQAIVVLYNSDVELDPKADRSSLNWEKFRSQFNSSRDSNSPEFKKFTEAISAALDALAKIEGVHIAENLKEGIIERYSKHPENLLNELRTTLRHESIRAHHQRVSRFHINYFRELLKNEEKAEAFAQFWKQLLETSQIQFIGNDTEAERTKQRIDSIIDLIRSKALATAVDFTKLVNTPAWLQKLFPQIQLPPQITIWTQIEFEQIRQRFLVEIRENRLGRIGNPELFEANLRNRIGTALNNFYFKFFHPSHPNFKEDILEEVYGKTYDKKAGMTRGQFLEENRQVFQRLGKSHDQIDHLNKTGADAQSKTEYVLDVAIELLNQGYSMLDLGETV